MVNLVIVHRIILFGSILQLVSNASAARCFRSLNTINCERADRGVIDRLDIYYENDVSLIVKNSSMPILESGMFSKLKFLEKLSLTMCGIRIIEDGAFQGMNLTHLNLAKNSIQNISINIFENLNELKFLDLSHNVISRLELTNGVNHLPELKYIDVSNNSLKNFKLIGNFSSLETVNFQNNELSDFQIDVILHLPKIKEVFFDGNSFNKSFDSFVTFVLVSSNIKINFDNQFFDDQWMSKKNITDKISTNNIAGDAARSLIRNEIEKDFKLSPEVIKSLNPSQLTNLVERILTLRNFTLNEREMLENDRRRIMEESRSAKKEWTRIDQIIKRYKEVSGEAKQETVGEYIEKSCQGMPDDTWWKRFKKWKCKKLFNWVKRLISR